MVDVLDTVRLYIKVRRLLNFVLSREVSVSTPISQYFVDYSYFLLASGHGSSCWASNEDYANGQGNCESYKTTSMIYFLTSGKLLFTDTFLVVSVVVVPISTPYSAITMVANIK